MAIELSAMAESGNYSTRGIEYAQKGDYDQAIAEFTKAIAINPEFFAVYVNRGNAYRQKGDNERAIADYTQAIKINSDKSSVYNQRGLAYLITENIERAIADFTRSLEIEKNVTAYFNRANAYVAKGEEEMAMADLKAATQLDPEAVKKMMGE